MKLAQRVMKWLHPEDEAERMKLRMLISQASAAAEGVTRTVRIDGDQLREWIQKQSAQQK